MQAGIGARHVCCPAYRCASYKGEILSHLHYRLEEKQEHGAGAYSTSDSHTTTTEAQHAIARRSPMVCPTIV